MRHGLRPAALALGLLVPGLAAAQCASDEDTLFACSASGGELVALCASPDILRTDDLGTTTIDPSGTLRFRAQADGRQVVVPGHSAASIEAFDADRGSAAGAGAWWTNLSATDGPHTVAVSVGVSDTRDQQIEFWIEDREGRLAGRFTCADLGIDATPTRRGVDDRYHRVVSALAE